MIHPTAREGDLEFPLGLEKWPPKTLTTVSTSRKGPRLVVLTTACGDLHEGELGMGSRGNKVA